MFYTELIFTFLKSLLHYVSTWDEAQKLKKHDIDMLFANTACGFSYLLFNVFLCMAMEVVLKRLSHTCVKINLLIWHHKPFFANIQTSVERVWAVAWQPTSTDNQPTTWMSWVLCASLLPGKLLIRFNIYMYVYVMTVNYLLKRTTWGAPSNLVIKVKLLFTCWRLWFFLRRHLNSRAFVFYLNIFDWVWGCGYHPPGHRNSLPAWKFIETLDHQEIKPR